MTDLVMPKITPRVSPLGKSGVNDYVKSEYDKSLNTWGIPNNLIKTMAWLPQLALTEVDYANSFIFDVDSYGPWPDPAGTGSNVMFPLAGFVDRVTKELVINLVSLLNRSRYSITHHTVIGYKTLCSELKIVDDEMRERTAEEMLLRLVNAQGKADFENRTRSTGEPLYGPFQLLCLRLALAINVDAHSVSDELFRELTEAATATAKARISSGPLAPYATSDAYIQAYVKGMLVEITWCICHFNGLLNSWFTVLRVLDEADDVKDEINFIAFYNASVPERIKVRNNSLLGHNGWGDSSDSR
jgi:hypothetical protein